MSDLPAYEEDVMDLFEFPVISIKGAVAFPSLPISLGIERERSIAACERASRESGIVFIVTEKNPMKESPKRADVFKVGCISKIKQSVKSPEGDIRLLTEGISRAKIKRWRHGEKCDYATVTFLKSDDDDEEIRKRAKGAMYAIISLLRERKEENSSVRDSATLAATITSPGLLADFVASSILVRWEDKQAILEEADVIKRLNLAYRLLSEETEVLETEEEIASKVRDAIGDSQREHYLREQLRVITDELGGDDDDYYAKIAEANLPEDVEKKLLREAGHIQQLQFGSPELALLKNYLDTCLSLPWHKRTVDRVDIASAKKILDEDHDGLEKVKERIIEYLAVKQLSPELKHQIICLVGPPGTGKTSVAISIARAMKRKYVRVSLGGIRDEADIRGHRKTYIGAMPGRIINALIDAGVSNPLILFDEIDKMTSDAHGDPASALLEVLDSEQNKNFRDHFIEIPFDLSDCMFICTANTLDTVPRPLIDRMEIIELSSYTHNEKLSIAKNHLIPKQCKRHGLDRRRFRIKDDAVSEIIDFYTEEAGVRELEREIAALCRKIAKQSVADGKTSISVGAADIKGYLGPRKLLPEHISDSDEVGVVNGMAYTSVGGDLLKIEVLVMDGTGKLELTGSLGDVMKESAELGVSYIRAHADELSVDREFYKNKDIHIHVPEGAVPKDGPSAGVTMLSAMTSALSCRPARRDTAMTGELTLSGRVLPIGGLREKTAAAYAAGVKRILIPRDNETDLEEIDPTVRKNVDFIMISNASEALSEVLLPPALGDSSCSTRITQR
ncbi:MAG: endopeptidase La [Clostridia bacterium]|nr:endopeptidase La [Clostridia bacterium]